MTRQNYYKARRIRQRQAIDATLIVELVRRERRKQPRMGHLKLYGLLRDELRAGGVRIGRDRFLGVLRAQDLLVEPLPKAPQTTMSGHSLGTFENLIRGLEGFKPNEVWVSDITYLRTREGYGYLSLITDMGSRTVVGYHLGRSLESTETLHALEMALKTLPADASPIHHSDRGCQYCCHEYIDRLKGRGLRPSMTEYNHCAENAMAERVNGILKQEYSLGLEFRTLAAAERAVKEAVWLYNHRRPHRALNMRIPAEVHGWAA